MTTRSSSREFSAPHDNVSQLSCELCSERKVRCDKRSPCSQCSATGVVCKPVYRKRLPRGRHVKSLGAENKQLQDRVAKLERLVANHDSTPEKTTSPNFSTHAPRNTLAFPPPVPSPSSQFTTSVSAPNSERSGLPSHPANGFWGNLVDKHPDLRGIMSDSKNELDPMDSMSAGSSGISSAKFSQSTRDSQRSSQSSHHNVPGSVLGFGIGHFQSQQTYLDAALALRPPHAVHQKLCQAYVDRVAPAVKVLHCPTLTGFLLYDKPYLGYHDTDPILDLLRAAVFFMAIVTLTDDQCRSEFNIDKPSLVDNHRLACEVALDRVGLITTEDVTVLQSFVLYLMALRCCERSRHAWTLFATAVRLATGMGINADNSKASESFFDQQMRRRLWYSICHMDSHLSFEHGSEPIISPKMHPRLPLNINDHDFGPDSEHQLKEREGFTEMSLALIHYKLQTIGKSSMFDDTLSDETALKVAEVESAAKKLLRDCNPSSSAIAWSAYNGALSILAGLQLYLRRPMRTTSRARMTAEQDSTNILRLAVTMLEHDIIKRTDARLEPFRWFGMGQWHSLAVAVAECYACDNVALLRHVWPTVETSFEYHSTTLARERKGVMGEPLERLMIRTRSRVKVLCDQDQTIPSVETNGRTTDTFNPNVLHQSGPLNNTTMHIASPSNLADPRNDDSTGLPLAAWIEEALDQNNQDLWSLDSTLDESLWASMMEPSALDLGRETWDDFINGLDYGAIEEKVACQM